MRFSPFQVLKFLIAFSFVAILAACGGGSSKSKSPTSTLTVSPTTISLNKSDVQQLSTTAKNAAGTQIFPTITYSTSDPNIANVSTSGSICGGTWDSSFIACTPKNSGTATITATADGVTATATVNVHDRITRILVNPPSSPPSCISQNQTETFTAQVFSGNVDISSTPGVAGTFAFTITDGNIGSIDSGSGVVTAKNSGATNVSGSITGLSSPVTATPAVFVTCPPKTISLHVDQASDTSFSLNLSDTTTKQLAADVTDTLGNAVSGLSLTYTSNQPATASISSAGLVTAVGAGNATFVASCTPPSCNPGLSGASAGISGSGQAVYSNVALGTVSGTSTSTAYVASTASTNLIRIPTDTNIPDPTAITLPQTPNSFVWNRQGTKAYLGSGGGLMVLDPSSNSVTVVQGSTTGKVLAVSLDGNKVVIANDTTVFVYDVGRNSFESFSQVPNAVAADFPADSSKAFIINATKLGIYMPGASFTTMTLSSANDVVFIAQGAAGFVADSPVNAFATCRNIGIGSVSSSTNTKLIRALPNGTQLIAALSAPPSPGWLEIAYTISPTAGDCRPTLTIPPPTLHVGISSVPDGSMLQVAPDGSRVFLTYQGGTAMTPTTGIPFYNTVTRTAGSIALVGGGAAFTGGITLDSQNLYVGSKGDNKVHLISVASGTDTQQIVVDQLTQSDGTQAIPQLVTVQPK